MLAACVSCSDSFESKDLVRFSARTGNPGTKVSYSGYKESNRERVDWKDGDMVWIWCPEAQIPSTHQAYYVIRDINENGYYSEAGIDLYSTEGMVDGLRWNEEKDEHHFFSVYPVPMKNRSVFFRLVLNQGEWDNTCSAFYGATIPASQAPVSVTASPDGKVAEPDCNNLIMAAQGAYPKNSVVSLDYEPVVTAVEFTVKNGYADQGDMTLSGIKLSAQTDDIAGKFTNYLAGGTTPLFENTTKEIEIPFENQVSIAYGQTLKFTVFMLGMGTPSDPEINDMTIEFETGSSSSIKAKLSTSAGPMAFPRAKKSYVTGLLIPGASVWTISAVPDAITAWDSDAMDVEVEYEAGTSR